MRRRIYEVTLDVDVRYRVEFRQHRREVVEFAVQLEYGVEEARPVIRFDTAHGFPHCDRYRADGFRVAHKPMIAADLGHALDIAIADVLDNWEGYVRPFRRNR